MSRPTRHSNTEWDAVPAPQWARFGERDVRGALNFLTPETIRSAAALVRDGEVISLNMPLDRLATGQGGKSRNVRWRIRNEVRPLGSGRYAIINDDDIEFSLQLGTHWDSFGHFGLIEAGSEGVFYGGRTLDATREGGPLRINSFAPGLVARGVLLDAVAVLGNGETFLPEDYSISSDDITKILAVQDVSLERGDVVCIYTGFEHRIGVEGRLPSKSAGLHAETMQIWHDSEITALVADNPAVERMPPAFALHSGALRNLGILLGELWALAELARACNKDRRWIFMFVSVPLRIPAFGSPGNGIAIR